MLAAGDDMVSGVTMASVQPQATVSLPASLGGQLGYAVAAVNAFNPSPPPLLPGVKLPQLGNAEAATFVLNALADRYHIDMPKISSDPQATWESISQRFVPALKSHFDMRTTATASKDIEGEKLDSFGGTIVAQAVDSGLLTFSMANILQSMLSFNGYGRLSASIDVYRKAADWFAPGRLVPRIFSYALLGVAACLGFARSLDAREVSVQTFLGALVLTGIVAVATEVAGSIFHRRRVNHPTDVAISSATQTILDAERMLAVPYQGRKVTIDKTAPSASGTGEAQG